MAPFFPLLWLLRKNAAPAQMAIRTIKAISQGHQLKLGQIPLSLAAWTLAATFSMPFLL
jgi:hypothetical protein